MTGSDFSQFFTQLFTALDTKDSILMLLFLLISFLLGWLFRSFSARSKYRRLQRAFNEKEKELITITANYNALKEQFKHKEDELKKVELELDELQVGYESIYREKDQLSGELTKAREHINEHGAKDTSYETELANAHLQIEQLRAANTAAHEELGILQVQLQELSMSKDDESELENQHKQIEHLQARIAELEAGGETSHGVVDAVDEEEGVEEINLGALDDITEIQSNYAATSDRLAAIERKLESLEQENAGLKKTISNFHQNDTSQDLNEEGYVESTKERTANARKAINEVLGGRIKKAAAAERDELQKINGVGSFIESKLNEIGIYTFEQISQFDDDFIEQVTAAIQFFPGRIKRDNWVGQAKELMK